MTAPTTPTTPATSTNSTPAAPATGTHPTPATAHLPAFAPDFPRRRAEAMQQLARTILVPGDGNRGRVTPRVHPSCR